MTASSWSPQAVRKGSVISQDRLVGAAEAGTNHQTFPAHMGHGETQQKKQLSV